MLLDRSTIPAIGCCALLWRAIITLYMPGFVPNISRSASQCSEAQAFGDGIVYGLFLYGHIHRN
ncbi:hypothetical protein B0O99DRAFT_302384 [Bisporella sp. PMI_857]|nr:hypothetical protein B0O99DRAFT_302384 [Bisporella sp. PMI_857]